MGVTSETAASHPSRDRAASPLTPAQMLFWSGQALAPEAPLYNMAFAWSIHGPVDPERFRRTFTRLVHDADVLRTVIRPGSDGLPRRVVRDAADGDQPVVDLPVVDLRTEDDPAAAADTWVDAACRRTFDLATRTFDSALLLVGERRVVWYLCQHHIVTDAWSMQVLFDAMAERYAAAGDAAFADLAPVPDRVLPGADEDRPASADHWARFTEADHPTPAFYGRRPTGRVDNQRVSIDLGADRSAALRSLATRPEARALSTDLSVFGLVATTYAALVHRVAAVDDVVLGAPAHNRTRPADLGSTGLAVEVFPLDIDVDPGDTFRSLLETVRASTDRFLRNIGPGRSTAALARSYHCVLNMIRATFGDFAGFAVTTRWLHPDAVDPAHVVRLQIHDFDATGSYQVDVDMNTSVFDAELRSVLPRHFTRLLDALLEDWDQSIAEVPLADETEQRAIIAGTEAQRALEPTETVLGMFHASVDATPDAVAVRAGDAALTYGELDGCVNHVAALLEGRRVGPGDIVAVCTQRSIETVVAMLGTLAAGAAWVPVDPDWPPERIELVLADAGTTVVLTSPGVVVDATPADVVEIDLAARRSVRSERRPGLDDVAYLIYTSGSTGAPKGAAIGHRGFANYVGWCRRFYGEGLTFPLFSPLTFDLTVTSLFVPIASGGSIVVYPETDAHADTAVLDVFDDDEVDIVKLTPSHLALLGDRPMVGARIGQLILGGEDLGVPLARRVWQAFDGHIRIHNEYGPTEATVGCVVHTYDPSTDTDGSVPIGRAVDGMRAHVLGADGDVLPDGVVGELYLAGTGLAIGYHERPELTAERFVAGSINPVLGESRLYRTGDRARRRPDGVIEYLGRTDDQVKVRGARVELGEVESALATHPAVTTAAAAVLHRSTPDGDGAHETIHCVRCGLASNYPGVTYDEARVCNHCRAFDRYVERAGIYFEPMDVLRRTLVGARHDRGGTYDCLALLSGGKDSTYVLCQLVDMGLSVLAFTLDNGYISDDAKGNIQRVVDELGVDHVFGSTPAMPEIFRDSLMRHCNVCQGCFKTIYTLSTQLAVEHDIPYIVTGLSRGQFFETRLTAELFTDLDVDVATIDEMVLEARKAYHRVDDAPRRLLDVSVFDDDDVFEQVRFVDFYRYCDVDLDDLYDYLDRRVPWVRPSDTGRSTNCLINDAGIWVHTRERGFHNYALPYSWDVRMGHKTREAALDELDDDIDVASVQRILDDIGYESVALADESAGRLVGYYVADADIDGPELRHHMTGLVPAASVPSQFVRVEALPLTRNGKVDRAALPDPGTARPEVGVAYVAPRTETERILCGLWGEVLGVDRVGTRDDFFELGGDSIMAIQIVARAQRTGVAITPTQLFETPNIEALAALAGATRADAGPRHVGEVGFTPAQRWLIDQDQPTVAVWNQLVRIEVPDGVDPAQIQSALDEAIAHHDALRQSFEVVDERWRSEIHEQAASTTIEVVDGRGLDVDGLLDEVEAELHDSIDLARPPLIAAAFVRGDSGNTLVVAAHHFIVDAISWSVLIGDLTDATAHHTASLERWTTALDTLASEMPEGERAHWERVSARRLPPLPVDIDDRDAAGDGAASDAPAGLVADERTIVVELPAAASADLLGVASASSRISVHELLVTSLAGTIGEWTGDPAIRLFVEGHGRDALPDLDVSQTLGWFTSIYPVDLDLSAADAVARLHDVKDRLRSVPRGGAGYGVLRHLGDDPGAVALDAHEHLLFNYLGRTDPLAATPWRLRRPLELHRAPELRRPFLVEVVARFVDDRLRVEWAYSSRHHTAGAIEQRATTMLDHVRAMTDAARERGADLVSGTDFPLAGLDERKLGMLAAALGDEDDA